MKGMLQQLKERRYLDTPAGTAVQDERQEHNSTCSGLAQTHTASGTSGLQFSSRDGELSDRRWRCAVPTHTNINDDSAQLPAQLPAQLQNSDVSSGTSDISSREQDS